jgi:hypothetical protein
MSEDKTEQLKKTVPSDDGSIFSSFNDSQSATVPGVIGGMIGLQNTDRYSILERTNIEKRELNVLVDMIRLAEHGIGGEVLDIPILYIGKQVVNYLRAKVSIAGEDGEGRSRKEVVEIMNQWAAKLEAREAESKKQRQGVAG